MGIIFDLPEEPEEIAQSKTGGWRTPVSVAIAGPVCLLLGLRRFGICGPDFLGLVLAFAGLACSTAGILWIAVRIFNRVTHK